MATLLVSNLAALAGATFSTSGNLAITNAINTIGGGNLYLVSQYNTVFNSNVNTQSMVITATGNIGIATSNPTANLHVAGPALFSGNTTFTGTASFSVAPAFTGNPAFSGNPVFSGNPQFCGAPVFNGVATFNSGPVFPTNPLFSGNPQFTAQPVFTNNPTFSGSPIFSGTPQFTGSLYLPVSISGNPAFTGNPSFSGNTNINGTLSGSPTIPGTFTHTGTVVLSGGTSNPAAIMSNAFEVVSVTASAMPAAYNFYINTADVQYYTANNTTNWSLNFAFSSSASLNSVMSNGQGVTVSLIVTNGSSAYYPTSYTIDGNTVTPKWQGGSAPTGGDASATDVYVYTIIKTASATFTVLASQTKFA